MRNRKKVSINEWICIIPDAWTEFIKDKKLNYRLQEV